jgi:hypothetical protein
MALKKVGKAAAKTAKKAAKGGGKGLRKIGGKQPEYKVGDTLQFVGYATKKDKNEKPVFKPGDPVTVAAIEEQKVGDGDNAKTEKVIVAVMPTDFDKYKADPEDESITGDVLAFNEVKRFKGKPPALPVEVKNVGDLNKLLKKGDLLDTARGLYEDAQKNFFYFGGVLAHIYHESKYKTQYGFNDPKTGWDEFCQQNFGFKGRKGLYWVDIYMKYSAIPNFDPKKLESIGWSKAAVAANYVTADNVDEIIDKAEDENFETFRETLKEEFTSEGKTATGRAASRGASKVKRITFGPYRLYEDQAEGVALVLDSAKKQVGSDDPNVIFEHIVMQWATDHLSANKLQQAQRAQSSKRKALVKAGVKLPGADEDEAPAKKAA